MPGNPFKKAAPRSTRTAAPKTPEKVKARIAVPTPEMPNGVQSKKVTGPYLAGTKVTTKGRHGKAPPAVKQGAQMGTPGRSGSRPGARPY